MPKLFVNLDHVATLRQVRGTPYPDVLEAAQLAARSGCVDGITLHLREDRRHAQDEDMRRIRQEVPLPFNFEMSLAPDVVRVCHEVGPAQATLVPERREELTTEGGLDIRAAGFTLIEVIQGLQADGILVSLFIDPTREAVALARDTGASHVELHTGRYADAALGSSRSEEADLLADAAAHAQVLGLVVNAGHGLTTENVGVVAAIPGLADLNIGHAIVSRAVLVGLPEALREMSDAIRKGVALAGPDQRG
jgi:pyridoxine 5-phosphate synthase